ncbi:MAG: hypothetical protein AABY22_00115, partial [Nanoarchaeota archaeon]
MFKKLYRKYMKNNFFVKENLFSEKEEISESGKYRLIIEKYKTKEGCWKYSRGRVYNTKNNSLIADVKMNYHDFPYLFVENHSDGHDYLICHEDYQGQTIVQLDTGSRINYLPNEANKGVGFCWASYKISPNKKYLAVNGCVWGGPYEIVIYDFSDPMNLPYKQLAVDNGYGNEIKYWNEDNSINLAKEVEIRKSDGKRTSELSEEEQFIYDYYRSLDG